MLIKKLFLGIIGVFFLALWIQLSYMEDATLRKKSMQRRHAGASHVRQRRGGGGRGYRFHTTTSTTLITPTSSSSATTTNVLREADNERAVVQAREYFLGLPKGYDDEERTRQQQQQQQQHVGAAAALHVLDPPAANYNSYSFNNLGLTEELKTSSYPTHALMAAAAAAVPENDREDSSSMMNARKTHVGFGPIVAIETIFKRITTMIVETNTAGAHATTTNTRNRRPLAFFLVHDTTTTQVAMDEPRQRRDDENNNNRHEEVEERMASVKLKVDADKVVENIETNVKA